MCSLLSKNVLQTIAIQLQSRAPTNSLCTRKRFHLVPPVSKLSLLFVFFWYLESPEYKKQPPVSRSSIFVTTRRDLRRKTLADKSYRIIIKNSSNQPVLRTPCLCVCACLRIFGFGHDWKPARPRLEIGAAANLMRWRPNQSRQSSFHQVTFYCTDPDERILHRRPLNGQVLQRVSNWVGRRLLRRRVVEVLVQTTPEGTWMRGGRTQAGPLAATLLANHLVAMVVGVVSRRRHRHWPSRGDRSVDGHPHRRRWRDRSQSVEVDARGRRRSVEEAGRSRGAKAGGGGWREGRHVGGGGRVAKPAGRRHGALKRRRYGQHWPAGPSRRCRHFEKVPVSLPLRLVLYVYIDFFFFPLFP